MTESVTEAFSKTVAESDLRQICKNTAKCVIPNADAEHLMLGAVDLRAQPETDAVSYAAVIWDKENNTFGLAFPIAAPRDQYISTDGDFKDSYSSIIHRTRVHFYNGAPVKESSAFHPMETIYEAVPQLQGKAIQGSGKNSRMITGLTHDQASNILSVLEFVNQARKEEDARRKMVAQTLETQISNSFMPKRKVSLAQVQGK